MSTRATVEKHALGFGLLGFAWPILWIFGRALLWLLELFVFVAIVIGLVFARIVEHFRSRHG